MTDFPSRYIQIDSEGYFSSSGIRVADEDYGRGLFKAMRRDELGRFITNSGEFEVGVEAFDQPFVVQMVERQGDKILAIMPYSFTKEFALSELRLDEWDRFHSRTANGIPMVLSRAAQAKFFNLLDDYDDDSITLSGKKITPLPWLPSPDMVNDSPFWRQIYQTQTPPWELRQPTPALPQIVPQLKLPLSKILVLGSGSGHDAAFLAQLGHFVTAVDFSDEAIGQAKKEYGSLKNLEIHKHDLFSLPTSWANSFDLVFEHTCYCAIAPDRRNELVQVWRRNLRDDGHVLGVFFVWDKLVGPPWGGSEWELRERFRKYFQFRYWTRWHHSVPKRQGTELVAYLQK